jgi:cytochrome c oxidase cbb3-type subunit 3
MIRAFYQIAAKFGLTFGRLSRPAMRENLGRLEAQTSIARTKHGSSIHCGARALGVIACALLCAANLESQEQNSPRRSSRFRRVEPSTAEGQRTFESRCSGCHGLDGRGGERAPDIATSANTPGRSDDELFEIIQKGLPGAGMPSFASLDGSNIKALVSYLRRLQGRSAAAHLPGDAWKGRALFYGKARCSECHMVAGAGGFIAADLTGFGGSHTAEEIRNEITKPNDANRLGSTMIVTTRDGRSLSGVVRNEDNFSIQLETLDGEFRLFLKSELNSFARQREPLMPSDYGSTLSAGELNDLVAFLLLRATHGQTGATSPKKSEPDEEDQ